ncbi:MAG: hypothetical protein JNM41_08685 [Flavipsychrobacter sp.]|nr:hypothetical protein [Flavipsychrobacter sp.]
MKRYNNGQGNYGGGNSNPANRVFFGVALSLIGLGLLLKALGILPSFVHFSFPVILIIIGLMIGIKNNFRNNSWWILMAIGLANAIPQFEIMGRSSKHLVWPLMLVIMGLMIAFRPKRKSKCYPQSVINSQITNDNKLMVDIVFGGRKEIVTTKDFKGGIVSVTFGGSEINLTQADFTDEQIVLDCRVTFGGVELIVPAHWEIQNNIVPSMGSVEDERMIYTGQTSDIKKKLILQGTCNFGSIEIKSY